MIIEIICKECGEKHKVVVQDTCSKKCAGTRRERRKTKEKAVANDNFRYIA